VISSSHLKFCPERGRLLDLLSYATARYAAGANELSIQMATLSQADYLRMRTEVENARLEAQQAREALFLHVSEHGCKPS
jgi:hypothetical protein